MKVFDEKGITHLDLHGVRHLDASYEVIDFVYQYQSALPLMIICGNSNRMIEICLLYTSPSPRDPWKSRMPSSA